MPLSDTERTWIEQIDKKTFMRILKVLFEYHRSNYTPHMSWVIEYLENINEVKQHVLARCIKEGWELP